jgi:hypothetical protein
MRTTTTNQKNKKKRPRRMVFTILRTALIAYGVILLLAFVFQRRLIYFPFTALQATPDALGLRYEDVHFQAEDGTRLHGWFIPAEEADGVLLFCHGNAGNISHRLESIGIFHRLGLDVFIFDYRGYGQSEGKPSEMGTYQDAEAAWRYLTEKRKIKPSRIIIFGRSLGGAVAAWLAQHHTPAALVLESTFTAMPDIAATHYPYLPVRLLLRFKYDTTEYLKKVDCPVLIVHSRDDEIMPSSHGQRLFAAAPEPKNFLEISGTHNEGFLTSGSQYQEGLNAFITEHLD